MNIFAVSRSPLLCARALDDSRLRKMILETAQILCTVVNLGAGQQITPYKNTHAGNAITLWARDPRNFTWLIELGNAYSDEYFYRFGKYHASSKVIEDIEIEWLVTLVENKVSKEIGPVEDRGTGMLSPHRWHNAAARSDLGISFKHIADTHLAYRLYLNARWATDKREPKFTRRGPPKWAEIAPRPS